MKWDGKSVTLAVALQNGSQGLVRHVRQNCYCKTKVIAIIHNFSMQVSVSLARFSKLIYKHTIPIGSQPHNCSHSHSCHMLRLQQAFQMHALMTKHSSPDMTKMGRCILDNPVWLRNLREIIAQLRWIDISRRILGTIYPHYKCQPQEVDFEEK